MAAYKKPDVEVYQQFRLPQGDIRPAILQSCLVGPLYQIFKDEVIGAYGNDEHLYYFPHSLKPGALLNEATLSVRVIRYGEEFVVAKSNLVVTGLEGGISTGFETRFVDNTKDFMAMSIITHTDATSNDGDYLRIPAGANAGYHKILEIIDSHTLLLAGSLIPAASENYEIRSVGYVIEQGVNGFSLRVTPYMGFAGDVTVSFKALRTDRDRMFEWTYDDLVAEVGADQIIPENPLAFGASLTLSVLGQNHFVSAMPITSDDLAGYQAALEAVESEEVYGITCLTENMQVAHLLMQHVKAMSDPLEKRERIAIVNTGFMDEIIKVGYISVADGETAATGLNSLETVLTEPAALAANGVANTYTFAGTEPTRVSVHFDIINKNIANGAVVEYALASDVGNYLPVAADSDPYHVIITAPASDSIALVRYTAPSALTGNVNVFGLQTIGEAEYTEYTYMTAEGQITNIEPVTELLTVSASNISSKRVMLADKPINPEVVKVSIPNIQNFVQGDDYVITQDAGFWYVSWADRNMADVIKQGNNLKISYIKGDAITKVTAPTAGHKALKIRAYDVAPSTFAEKPENWVFPTGMVLHVVTEGSVIAISQPGTYVFDRDILAVYKTVSTTDDIADKLYDILIEVAFLVSAGSYSRNKFSDADAEFVTGGKVAAGDKLVIYNGASSGEYLVTNVISNTELLVDKQFIVFESGLEYQVKQGDVSKQELATWISDLSTSFAERRVTHVYCPLVGRSTDGISVEVLPGYFYNCIIVGLIQVMAPQAGMTNMSMPGFTQVFYVSDFFTEKQLDTIAGGGTFVIMQHNKWSVPYVRHQLTTDMSMIEKRELSCVKDLDYIAKMGRETLRPYIGRFLVNEVTMTTLYSVANAFLAKCREEGLVNRGDLIKIYVDPNARDTVIICIEIELPVPLNKIKLFIYV